LIAFRTQSIRRRCRTRTTLLSFLVTEVPSLRTPTTLRQQAGLDESKLDASL